MTVFNVKKSQYLVGNIILILNIINIPIILYLLLHITRYYYTFFDVYYIYNNYYYCAKHKNAQ